ncbi:MAG TPA: hypothetical protein VEA81_00885 [Burkholderiaceae bacterium]|nr:hypothetical protein [Burkholderiaceae bacterium]
MATAGPSRRGSSLGRFALLALLAVGAIAALYVAIVYNWSYSSGERAGWVQKFSKKGWFCKTWEGEIALVSMPGAIPEKFLFTVLDDSVAEDINRHMGRRVALHYEQKVGLPTSCFGETRYYVTRVVAVPEGPGAPFGAPGAAPQGAPAPGGASVPGASPVPGTAPAPGTAPVPGTAPLPGTAPVPGGAPPAPAGSTPGLPSIPAPATAPPAAPAAPAGTPPATEGAPATPGAAPAPSRP